MKAVALTPDVLLNVQLANMQTLMSTAPDSSFDNHLSKVSRNIYDKFLEHLGILKLLNILRENGFSPF